MTRKLLLALLLLWLSAAPLLRLDQEKLLKVIMLEKLSRFVKWPDKVWMKDKTSPFIIGIIGEDPFGSLIANVYGNIKIIKKKVRVRYFEKTDEVDDCQILFISNSLKDEVETVIAALKKKPILTIGDTEGYAHRGVHINLFKAGKNIGIEINPRAIRAANMSVSASFLSFATIVKTGVKKK